MTLRVVQRGSNAGPVLALWMVGPSLDDALRAALPGVAIVASAARDLTPDLEAVRRLVPHATGRLIAGGWSAACQTVRYLVAHHYDAIDGAVCLDGTSGSVPPAERHLAPWRRLGADARAGTRLFVATCTQQDYVERLPAATRYAWTRHVLESALAVELPAGAELHDGGLHVYSAPSAAIDGPAHVRELHRLPELLALHVRPWLGGGWERDTEPAPPPVRSQGGHVLAPPTPTPPPPPSTFGARLVAWYRAEMAAGVRETPAGGNTSPRIREYLAPCRRRGSEALLGLTAGAWCAAMASYGCAAVALPGEAYPAPRAAGLELQADAEEHRTWHPVSEVLSGAWEPDIGDLVICQRTGPAWARHVCVLAAREGEVLVTLGGNEGDAIRETRRALRGGEVLGVVSLRQREQVDRSRGPMG